VLGIIGIIAKEANNFTVIIESINFATEVEVIHYLFVSAFRSSLHYNF